ncbi:hypothetical protein F511_46820 [Dorcoceras hygrometricum]|uniref:Uncharacterized protein n=1 Tax=Dorcoceras hygrometricum TaxID=472368 RepID=A0A2Z6ZSL4_9LAMI|nr:hypothetical protein F511_46820 [Dorcoceras hygrometricum]
MKLCVLAGRCAPLIDVVRRSLREEAAMCVRWPQAKAGRSANRCATIGARCVLAVRRCARRLAPPPRCLWWWRRRRPPLRRVSGDVVTAGLISSRFWFGLVSGSP